MKRGLVIALFLVACNREQSTTATSSSSPAPSVSAAALSPEDLGTLGAAIKKSPADAQRLLTERGLTEESFAQAIRKVSEDPAAAKRYTAAYHKAGA
jgi:hypothetical protein